jgi:hypothetical protein
MNCARPVEGQFAVLWITLFAIYAEGPQGFPPTARLNPAPGFDATR